MITLVQKNRSKGILTWYARVPDPHRKNRSGHPVTHFFSLGTTSKSEAKIIMQERLKQGCYELHEESESMTLGTAVQKFENYERSKGTKKNSISTMSQAVNMLKSLFNRKLSSIKTGDIAEAFQSSSEHISPVTYRNRKTVLTTFFNYLVDVLEVYPKNPIKKAIPRRKLPKKVKDFWTKSQVDRIIAKAPTPKSRLVWSFMAFAGLRKSEATSMKPEMIYEGRIHVKGKGDKEATIPVCPRLRREIDRYNGDWKLSFNRLQFIRIAHKAIPEGFPGKANAHRLRHSFASALIRDGKNIKVVQELLRHQNVQLTLDTYGHLLDTDAEKAISDVFK